MLEPIQIHGVTLNDYLEQGGADSAALVSTARELVGILPGDVLLAVGSLPEGLGTGKSDLDLLLITNDDRSVYHEESVGWTIGRCIVDLEVTSWTDVGTLLDSLGDFARRPWDLTTAPSLSYDDRLRLHRLLHGRLLTGPEGVDEARFRPSMADLIRLKLNAARHMARTVQVDMVGYRDTGDYASLVFAGQDLMGHVADALLAGNGITNPTPKWRLRLLGGLPEDWEQALATRSTGLSAWQTVWTLHRAPAEPDPERATEHALRCVTFARAVFAWAESEVLGHPEVARAAGRVSALSSGGAPLPRLELDVDFCLVDRAVVVARLNHFGGSFEISAQEFAALLLFDGRDGGPGSEILRPGAPGEDEQTVDAASLADRALGAGLCMAPDPRSRPSARA